MESYQRWLLMRRIRTKRQVQEVMTEFWLNHLNVPANGDATFTWRFDYDRQIRARALGSFRDILYAAVTHPAMGIYLNNAVSTKSHPNENLGRELLELHTVGRGEYTEDDVKNSARILTGWRRRHVAHLGRGVLRRGPLGGPGQGDGLQPSQREPRRSRGDPRLPHLPGPAPGDRPADRAPAGHQVRPRPTASGPGRPARQGLPRQRHRRSARCCGRWSSRPRSGSPAAPRSATPSRTSSPPTARSASGCTGRPRTTATTRPGRCCGSATASARTRTVGRAPTDRRSTTSRGPPRPGCSRRWTCTG